MKDGFGREIEYVRVSITSRCNLKCIYCNPDGSGTATPAPEALTPSEFERIVRSMTKVGIHKVRITGGEPLVRPDVCEIIERIARLPEVTDLAMTTNGIRLADMAESLKTAGLKRVNISMDSLQKAKFAQITGGGELEKVVSGIEKALEVGLQPVKTNTVLMKGVNDEEIDAFIRLTRERPLEVRLIELMPIGSFGEHNTARVIPSAEILRTHPTLIPCENGETGQPARYYQVAGYQGKIGLISPMSHQFCHNCNRIRLTCDGQIKLCLGDNQEVDVVEVLRKHPDRMDDLIARVIRRKPRGHDFGNNFASRRKMSMIGG